MAVRQLGDMFDRETGDTADGGGFDLSTPEGKEDGSATQTIRSSAAAYRDLNATLGNFYEEPARNDAEMEELMERISLLESELESEKEKGSTMDEQVALMEKSYELAAKYMGGQNGTQTAKPSSVQKAGKNKAEPVRQVERQVVSSLVQPAGNAEVAATCPQERNRGFNTAVGGTAISDKNTLSACVYGAQSVTDGQTVRLRLLEPYGGGRQDNTPGCGGWSARARYRVSGSTSRLPRWNTTARLSPWSLRSMTRTDSPASSSRTRWR